LISLGGPGGLFCGASRTATQARLRSSAGTAAMIPAGITARSHPGFSWSAGPTRSRWAWRRMRSTSGGTRGQPRRPAAGQLQAIGDLRGMRLAESVRGSGMLGWFCCWAQCWAEAGCRTRHPGNARSAAPLALWPVPRRPAAWRCLNVDRQMPGTPPPLAATAGGQSQMLQDTVIRPGPHSCPFWHRSGLSAAREY
jgi:hypothetical protein